MTKFSDTQAILLSTASQRDNGSVLPLPTGIKPGGGASKALTALIKRELIEERETIDAGGVHRTDGDLRYGLFLTPAGADAIGVDASSSAPAPAACRADEAGEHDSSRSTKIDTVLALLGRPAGATLADLVEATGWLPHTTRAALTGLRKKGYELVRGKREGSTCYTLGTAGDA